MRPHRCLSGERVSGNRFLGKERGGSEGLTELGLREEAGFVQVHGHAGRATITMKADTMTDPIAEICNAQAPALPRLAAEAARQLARPAKSVHDGLRAIEAWFVQHGDPFLPMDPAAFAKDTRCHRDEFAAREPMVSMAELLARLTHALSVLEERLALAAKREE